MSQAFRCDGCDRLFEGGPVPFIYSHTVYVKSQCPWQNCLITIAIADSGWLAAINAQSSIDLQPRAD